MKVRIRASKAELIGYACAMGAGTCYGMNAFMGKIAINNYAPPLVAVTIAMAFGTLMLTPLAARDIPRALRTQTGAVAMYAIAGMVSAASVVAIFFSIQRADVVVVAPIFSISPIFTFFLTHLFLRRLERVTLGLAAGTVLVVGGTVLVVMGNSL